MKLGTGDTITLEGGVSRIWCGRITLDLNKQKVYWLKYNDGTGFSSIISCDYNGVDKKTIGTDQKLNKAILGVWDNSIFVMKSDEARILMMNEIDSNLFRKFMIEKSNYFDLIIFNNKFNHTTGE